jgi:hypothetical protein
VNSTPVSVTLFRAEQRSDDLDCACAAIEHATSTRIPISEYLIGSAFQEVCTPLIAKVRGTPDYTHSPDAQAMVINRFIDRRSGGRSGRCGTKLPPMNRNNAATVPHRHTIPVGLPPTRKLNQNGRNVRVGDKPPRTQRSASFPLDEYIGLSLVDVIVGEIGQYEKDLLGGLSMRDAFYFFPPEPL